MEDNAQAGYPMTEKRKRILEMAFAQLRKSRAAIDPDVLRRIRQIVAENPLIKQKLGVTDDIALQDADMPLSEKGKAKSVSKQKTLEPKQSQSKILPKTESLLKKVMAHKQEKKTSLVTPEVEDSIQRILQEMDEKQVEAKSRADEVVKIDQAKNMETIAKLMNINPKAKDGIRAVLAKVGRN